jgi:two-component system, NtrC family, sensor histidine kinase KinB
LTLLRSPTLRAFLKGYLLLGIVLIAAVIGFYTLELTNRLEDQSEWTTSLVASIAGPVLFSENPDPRQQQQLRQVIEAVDFPFVFTDLRGRPIIWNPDRIGVPLPESYAAILGADLENPADPGLIKLLAMVRDFDRQRDPIDVSGPGDERILGRLHYGGSRLSQQLIWMPWLEAVLLLSFTGIVFIAFRNMKASEYRSVWVGMAKETAHQLGTPLTSLNGWLAILAEREHAPSSEAAETATDMDTRQILSELQRDAERLGKVSERFSQVGGKPRLSPGRVDETVSNVCNYFRTRLPHLATKVELKTKIEETPLAPINAQLLDWAVENLIKNALDALDKGRGVVELRCHYDSQEDWIEILVTDNGRGMSSAVKDRVFHPGFSTKQRGWGMGLALVRRIVDEYHGGRIDIARTVEGEGTSFRIRLRPR